jgi:hypothetical protein
MRDVLGPYNGRVALGKCATDYASAVVDRLWIQFLFRTTSFYPAVVSIVNSSIGHWQSSGTHQSVLCDSATLPATCNEVGACSRMLGGAIRE